MKYLTPILFALFLVGCDKPQQGQTPANTNLPDVPKVTVDEGTPSGLDMGVVNPVNTGYNHLDLDGDGINDFVILNGNSLNFSKGNGNGQYGPQRSILMIEGNVIAYNVVNDGGKIKLLYWDSNQKGWYRRLIGVANGTPYFGNVEGQ